MWCQNKERTSNNEEANLSVNEHSAAVQRRLGIVCSVLKIERLYIWKRKTSIHRKTFFKPEIHPNGGVL